MKDKTVSIFHEQFEQTKHFGYLPNYIPCLGDVRQKDDSPVEIYTSEGWKNLEEEMNRQYIIDVDPQ